MVAKQAKCAPDLWLGNPLRSPEPEFVPVPPRAGSQGSPRGSPWLSLYDTVWPLEKILTFSLSLFFFSFFLELQIHVTILSLQQLWKQKDML